MVLEIIAHRGYSAIMPENTLIAFQKALDCGAHSLEFDLQLSADNIPFLFHDQNLSRICGVSGTIAEKTASQLQQLDAGSWFDQCYQGEKIPSLESALPIFKQVPKFLYFDVKIQKDWIDDNVKKFLQKLSQYDLQDKAIITSFNETFLSQCREFNPQIKIGYFLVKKEDYEQKLLKAQQGNAIIVSVYYPVILDHPEMIEKSRQSGIELVVWTVDDASVIQKLQRLGIYRIISNDLSIFEP